MFEDSGLSQQIYDFTPGIAANGLFWTTIIPDGQGTINVDAAAGTATFRLNELELINGWTAGNTNFGGGDDPVAATASVDVVWDQPQTPFEHANPAVGFGGTFVNNQATMTWSAQWSGNTFVADAFSEGYAMVGQMRNGRFFDPSATAIKPSTWSQVKANQLHQVRRQLYQSR